MKQFIVAGFMTLVGMLGLVAVLPAQVDAAACPDRSSFLDFPNWYRGLECTVIEGHTVVDMGSMTVPRVVWTVAINMIEILMRVVGILAVVMILVSAFRYLTNGGNEQKIAAAKTSLTQAVIGLIIAILASTVIGFLMAGLTGGI